MSALYELPVSTDDGQPQPPQDAAAEQAVLGAMLLSRNAITDVVTRNGRDDFYLPAHQHVFDAILALCGRGDPADAVTVANELEQRKLLRRIGGAPYLHTLISTVPTAANAGYYAGIVAEKAQQRRTVEAGTRVVQYGYAGGEALDLVQTEFQALIESHRPAGEAQADLRSQLLSIFDLANLPPVEPLVDGLLYRNTLAQLSGPPGKYKSFVSIDISCALASGQNNWEGHAIRQREKVVYVAAEGASGLRARIFAWCEHNRVDPEELVDWLFILPSPIQLGAVVEVDDAVEMAQDVGAGLLVLDTRARCTLGMEENSATEQGEAVDAADRIRAAAGCTVWGIHHTGRVGTTPRGSTAWDGAVWTDLRLASEDEGTVEIRVEKHKDAPSGKTYNYRLTTHTVSENLMPGIAEDERKSLVVFSSGDENFAKIGLREKFSIEKLAENSCGLEGLSRSKLVDLAVQAGISQATAYRTINALVDAGRLHNIGTENRPKYIHTGRKLGDEEDDDPTHI